MKMSGAVGCVTLVVAALFASGCATTGGGEGNAETASYDPWEETNRSFFAFNNSLDKNILKPVSDAYVSVTPEPIRDNIFNFFDNLAYPNVVINSLLQGKFEQAVEGTGRFLVNSTLGIGGIIDIASGFGMQRHDEDLGQTLAVWGVSEGNYLDLPFFGPNTLRSVPGIPFASAMNPTFYADGAATFPFSLIGLIDKRARLDSAIRVRDETAIDPYVFQREAYRQRRLHLIYDGDPPIEDLTEDQ